MAIWAGPLQTCVGALNHAEMPLNFAIQIDTLNMHLGRRENAFKGKKVFIKNSTNARNYFGAIFLVPVRLI